MENNYDVAWLIFFVLAFCAFMLAAVLLNTDRQTKKKLQEVDYLLSQTHSANERLVGIDLRNASLRYVELEYDGGPLVLGNTYLSGCRIRLTKAAERTVHLLRQLEKMQPGILESVLRPGDSDGSTR